MNDQIIYDDVMKKLEELDKKVERTMIILQEVIEYIERDIK